MPDANAVKIVTSAANATIKLVRALEDKKHRRETGLYVAEGLRTALTAAEQGVWPETLIFSADLKDHPKLRDYVGHCLGRGIECIEASRQAMEKIARRDNPQGVVGIYRIAWAELNDFAAKPDACLIALQMIRDPGNLGTIMRTADAVGAEGIVLIDECCDPFSIEAVRASMGSIFAVKLARARFSDFDAWRKPKGGMLVGTSLRASEDYRKIDYRGPVFLLMGNEQAGLPAEYEDACDARVRIPMRGSADSLNVAVATAIVLYEINRKTL
jgi:TrmH family RNA methyltransferase